MIKPVIPGERLSYNKLPNNIRSKNKINKLYRDYEIASRFSSGCTLFCFLGSLLLFYRNELSGGFVFTAVSCFNSSLGYACNKISKYLEPTQKEILDRTKKIYY